jgi:hypothetical protein
LSPSLEKKVRYGRLWRVLGPIRAERVECRQDALDREGLKLLAYRHVAGSQSLERLTTCE